MANKEPGKESVHKFQVLVDSDAFVGRFYPRDLHHQRSLALFDELHAQQRYVVTTNMVIDEVATVLSHRQGQDLARKFLTVVEELQFPTIHIDKALRQEALAIFKAQQQRGMSVTDCANVAVMQRFTISEIFAFDAVYSKQFGLRTIV